MVNSGSSANLLAVSALCNPARLKNLKYGDEVIIPGICWSTSLWPLVQNNLMREKQVVKGNELRMSRMIESMKIENDRRLKRVANENAEMVRRLMCQNDEDSEKMMARQRKDESVMRQESSQGAAPECPVSS